MALADTFVRTVKVWLPISYLFPVAVALLSVGNANAQATSPPPAKSLTANTTFQLGTIQRVVCAKGSVATFFPGGQLASCHLATRAKLQHRNGQVSCEAGPVTFTPEGFVGSAGCNLSKFRW